MTANDTQENRGKEVAWVLWGILFASQYINFLILSSLPRRQANNITPEQVQKLLMVFAGIGLVILLLAIFVPRWMARASAARLPGGAKPGERRSESGVWDAIAAPYLLRLAMFEAICMVGFLAAFTSQELRVMLPFLAVSTVAFLRNTPTKEHFEQLLWA